MSGKMSRRKGQRVEYCVISYFRDRGYTATRVPLSGASQGEKGDIKLEIPRTRYGDRPMDAKFLWGEVKARATDFNTIYAFYSYYKERAVNIEANGELLTISTDFDDIGLITDEGVRCFTKKLPGNKNAGKVAARIARLKEHLKGCDFLIIKGDYKPLLFMRFYGKSD